MKDNTSTKGYLYSVIKGKLVVRKGEIGYYHWNENLGNFKFGKKTLLTSLYPEVVYRNNVWLTKKDDKLAIKLLIEYEENEISLLEDKIVNHRIKIHTLEKLIRDKEV